MTDEQKLKSARAINELANIHLVSPEYVLHALEHFIFSPEDTAALMQLCDEIAVPEKPKTLPDQYCPLCDYCISRATYDKLREVGPCPSCGGSILSRFYSYGSDTHRQRWEKYMKFGQGKPRSFPYNTHSKKS